MAPTHSCPLPPEVWICVFHHATHLPGTLIPEIYAHASQIGPVYNRACNPALRKALITKRALVRVCKQWWHLAVPYLYQSVYVGRSSCLSSLSSTLANSVAGKGTLTSTRPLGEYIRRLDITIRDHAKDANEKCGLLSGAITHMPYLAIVSFATSLNTTRAEPPNRVLDALHHSAASLRVLDLSCHGFDPSLQKISDLISRLSQLRILNCPQLTWSRELGRGGFPPTLTTLRLNAVMPRTLSNRLFPHSDPDIVNEPTALQELILQCKPHSRYWEDLLCVYSSQLISVEFDASHVYSINAEAHLELLTRICPSLRRLTITSEHFASFIRPNLVFPPITYLGLRVVRAQSTKSDFKTLFTFLEELKSNLPSLQVVQLLNERNLGCLLDIHTKSAVRALRPFTAGDVPFRLEDGEGVLLTGSRSC